MPDMPGSRPSIAARHFGPALRLHQLRPAAIELAMVALAHAEIAGPGVETLIKALVPKPHLRIYRHAPRNHPATSAGAFLPVVHVVLLESARRAEAAHPGQSDRLLDVRRCSLVDIGPRPHLGLVGAARVPDAEGPRGGAKHREIGKGR